MSTKLENVSTWSNVSAHSPIIALDDKDHLVEQLHKTNLDITITKPIDAIPQPLAKYKAFLLNDNKIRIVCEEKASKEIDWSGTARIQF